MDLSFIPWVLATIGTLLGTLALTLGTLIVIVAKAAVAFAVAFLLLEWLLPHSPAWGRNFNSGDRFWIGLTLCISLAILIYQAGYFLTAALWALVT